VFNIYFFYLGTAILVCRYKLFPVVVYECETWPLTLREGRRLGLFEKRVLRRIFGPKRGKITREWIKIHNEEPNDLYERVLTSP